VMLVAATMRHKYSTVLNGGYRGAKNINSTEFSMASV
jgi:hypothetical protein